MNSDYIKQCPQCALEYEANRLNQKFCSVKCKTRYNNNRARQRNSIQENTTTPINTILWKNRTLLEEYAGQLFKRKVMLGIGFKFNYVTHFTQNDSGKNLFYCYDYGYQLIDNFTMKIFKAEN